MSIISKAMVVSILVLLLVGVHAPTYANSVNFKGTVNYITLEGGFWGIISEDGKKYDPINLEESFKIENMPVEVEARVINSPSVHMWGKVIEILSINRL